MGVQSIRNLYPQIGSEIFVLLQKITAKIFSLKFALVDFGKCQFLLAGVKSSEISAPVLSYCLSKWRQNDNQGDYYVLVATPLNVFLCPCLEKKAQ